MSDFLSRLIDRARGTSSTVEPVIGSRFVPNAGLLLDEPNGAAGIRSPDSRSLGGMRQSEVHESAAGSVPDYNASTAAPGWPESRSIPALAVRENRRTTGTVGFGPPLPTTEAYSAGEVPNPTVPELVDSSTRQSNREDLITHRTAPQVGASAVTASRSSLTRGEVMGTRSVEPEPADHSTVRATSSTENSAGVERAQVHEGTLGPQRTVTSTLRGSDSETGLAATMPGLSVSDGISSRTNLAGTNARAGAASLGPAQDRRSMTASGTDAGGSDARESAQNVPQVRVTIGRIEVRAVTPPAPRDPAPLPKPRMSLTDYLRSFDRGTR